MPTLNRIVLIGRLTGDPELRYTASNLAVASFTVAVDRPTSKASGQEKKTDFFRCKAWRQKADFVSQWVHKGRLVAVEGRVELNEYTGQDGQRKFSTEVVVDQIETLDSPRDRAGEAAPSGGGYSGAGAQGGGYGGGRPAVDDGAPQEFDDPGYVPEDQAAPARSAPRPAAPPRAVAAAAPRPAAPAAPAAAPRPAARPAPAQPAYPDDDFDDSDPFADE